MINNEIKISVSPRVFIKFLLIGYFQERERMTTELEKLINRLFPEDDYMKIKNFKIFPGDKIHESTPEEIARQINNALDERENVKGKGKDNL